MRHDCSISVTTEPLSAPHCNFLNPHGHMPHLFGRMKQPKVLVLIMCGTTLLLHAGADPFIGTWVLDSRKSRFNVGDPSFMFATLRIESSGTGLKWTASAANGEGLPGDFTFDCSLDGRPCKVIARTPIGGSSVVETVSLKRIDDHTIVAIGRENERVTYSDRRVVSSDGKRMAVERTGISLGRKYESTIILLKSK